MAGTSPNRRLRWLVGIGLLAVGLAAAAVLLRPLWQLGAATPRAAVERYLDALAQRDRSAVRAAVEPRTAGDRIDLRLTTYGGTPRAKVSYQIFEPIRPGAGQTVDLSFGGRRDEVSVVKHRRGWFVRLPGEPEPCNTAMHEICDA